MCIRDSFRVIKTLTGLLPFLGIFLLMNYAINNYQRYGDNFDNVEGSYTCLLYTSRCV